MHARKEQGFPYCYSTTVGKVELVLFAELAMFQAADGVDIDSSADLLTCS